MSDEQDKFSIPPLAARAGGLLLAVAATAVSWWATPTGELSLPMKPLAPIATAFLAVLAAWASWTYSLHKRNSKRERIKEAHRLGRLICHCTESGEIMTQHHAVGHSIEVYACPICTNVEIVAQRGDVLIAEDTEFQPRLPATARMHWLQRSNAQR